MRAFSLSVNPLPSGTARLELLRDDVALKYEIGDVELDGNAIARYVACRPADPPAVERLRSKQRVCNWPRLANSRSAQPMPAEVNRQAMVDTYGPAPKFRRVAL
jgi:hypothetical protein